MRSGFILPNIKSEYKVKVEIPKKKFPFFALRERSPKLSVKGKAIAQPIFLAQQIEPCDREQQFYL